MTFLNLWNPTPAQTTMKDEVRSGEQFLLSPLSDARLRVLLVDDDWSFTKIFERTAVQENYSLTTCLTVKEVGKLPAFEFDVAIIDFDLGDINGVQLTQVLTRLRNIPVILVSQYRHVEPKAWPNCIKRFVHKSLGANGILTAAKEIYEEGRKYG